MLFFLLLFDIIRQVYYFKNVDMKKIALFLLVSFSLISCSELSKEEKAKNDDFMAKYDCSVSENNEILKCSKFVNKDPIGYKGFRALNDSYFVGNTQLYKVISEDKFTLVRLLFRKVNDIAYDHWMDWETFEYVWGDIVKDKDGVYLVNSPIDERPKKISWADAPTFVMWEDWTYQDKNQGYDKNLVPIKR